MERKKLILLAAAVALLAGACSSDDDDPNGAGDGAGDARTIEIAMVDIAFEPDEIEVERGDEVRFVFTNEGKVAHDAYIGDREGQMEHDREMDGGDDHGSMGSMGDAALTLDPGETGELTYTFDDAGTVEIGCHQPGHYEAGMKVIVTVT